MNQENKKNRLMSLLVMALIALMTAGMSSCSKDKDGEPDDNSSSSVTKSLVGTWRCYEDDGEIEEWELDADGTASWNDIMIRSGVEIYEGISVGRWWVKKDVIYLDFDDEFDTYRFKLKNNRLYVRDYNENFDDYDDDDVYYDYDMIFIRQE